MSRGHREHCLDCKAVLDRTTLACHRKKCPKPGGYLKELRERRADIETKIDDVFNTLAALQKSRAKLDGKIAAAEVTP